MISFYYFISIQSLNLSRKIIWFCLLRIFYYIFVRDKSTVSVSNLNDPEKVFFTELSFCIIADKISNLTNNILSSDIPRCCNVAVHNMDIHMVQIIDTIQDNA